jgi:hypothetical protein
MNPLPYGRDVLSFKRYIPLTVAEFGIESFELCEPSSGYLWNFFVYPGGGSDIITGTDVLDNLQSFTVIVRVVEPLVKLGYRLWTDSYYSLLSLCSLHRDNGINVTGTH